MYVCICNGYRASEIRDKARGGFRCAREAYHSMGSGPNCGQCLAFAQELIDSFHADDEAPLLAQGVLA